MTRIHLHIGVENVADALPFYETLFGAPPSFVREDYAKWSLEDPAVNLVISTHCGGKIGIDHIGIETGSSSDLAVLANRLKAAGTSTFDEANAHCCYAESEKTWVADPAGVRWETFFTRGQTTTYGEDAARDAMDAASPDYEAISEGSRACCGG